MENILTIAQVGKPAPPFTAPVAHPGEGGAAPVQTVSLSDYRGKSVNVQAAATTDAG